MWRRARRRARRLATPNLRSRCRTRSTPPRNVDARLPGKGNSNSHGPRPVHLMIAMTKWIRAMRLSIKNSLSPPSPHIHTAILPPILQPFITSHSPYWSQSSPCSASGGSLAIWASKTRRSAQDGEAVWRLADVSDGGAARKGDQPTPRCRGRLQASPLPRCVHSHETSALGRGPTTQGRSVSASGLPPDFSSDETLHQETAIEDDHE